MAEEAPMIVVGIGASAGGIEAFKRFFTNLAAPAGAAFVVILHLSPDRESMLPDLIVRWTPIPVRPITEGMPVEPGNIYVIPPNTILTIEHRRLHLREREPQHQANRPIDVFFSALALDLRENAVGIVLSGTGSDGSVGLRAIKNHGGLTLVQGGGDAAPDYPGMPDSAISTGAVDLVLPVEAMPGRLAQLLRAPSHEPPEPAPAQPPKDGVAAIDHCRLEICAILRNQVGHDFSQYKRATFLRRVQRRMQVLQTDAEGYVDALKRDPHEVGLLFKDLLIGVTSFFRDETTFETVGRVVMPALFEGKGAADRVRVWVSGCATGEEAYSLAIMLREAAERRPGTPKIEVFATDIDEAAIAVARNGRYPKALFADMSETRINRFFVTGDDVYAVTKEIRDICTFSTHSVIRDPPFSRMDLVACRNLLIYLDTNLQGQVLQSFNYALKEQGFLLLGSSETVTRHAELFDVVDKKHSIFRSRGLPGAPLSVGSITSGRLVHVPTATPPIATATASVSRAVQAANAQVLDRFAPAFVIVDPEGDIVHHSVRTGKYLEPALGPPTRNLIATARRGLRHDLRALLRSVIDSGEPAASRRVRIEWEPEDRRTVTIAVERLAEDNAPLYLVVFSDTERPEPPEPPGVAPDSQEGIVQNLERDLRNTREQLQSIVEEYETAVEELKSANEEMHSVNEELQSTNEELDTSKEEIQSINEELQTVNAQLTGKVDELDHANSDLRNLFENTRIATIFVAPDLVVRSFTPAASKLYNLIPSDIGRPITHIVSEVSYPDLAEDVARVLDTREAIERPVARRDGTADYLMRILPYRATGNIVDGAVITFADVTALVQAEQHQRMLIDELNHRVKNMLTVVIAICMQTLRRAGTLEAFEQAFLGRMHATSRAYSLVASRNWTNVTLAAIVSEEIAPYIAKDGSNFSTDLAEVLLKPRTALPLSLVLHELATNATKYGALSTERGRVTCNARLEHGRLFLEWIERGGPPVAEPTDHGFGTRLITRSVTHELNGEATLTFAPEGLHATLSFPLDPAPVALDLAVP